MFTEYPSPGGYLQGTISLAAVNRAISPSFCSFLHEFMSYLKEIKDAFLNQRWFLYSDNTCGRNTKFFSKAEFKHTVITTYISCDLLKAKGVVFNSNIRGKN